MAVSFRDLLKPAAVDDVEAAKRRQALAEAMYAKNMGPNLPQIGGPVQQKYGVGNALVDLANSLASAYNLKQANKGMRTAQDARNANIGEVMYQLRNSVPDDLVNAAVIARIKNTPDGQLAAPVYAESDAQRRMAAALGPDGPKALAEAALAQSIKRSDPELQANLDLKRATLGASIAERQAMLEQRILDREQRAADASATREQRAEAAREAAQLRRDLMAMQKQIADQASADRRYAVDNRPNPAAAKADAAAAKADEAKSQVDNVVATLNSYYDALDKNGGIVNPDKGMLSNLGASISSSGVGQAVGRAVGTENQSARNSIKQARPLLLQYIKNATGMSAQQMNSNVELKLWLEAATDPQLDVRANRENLGRIQQMIGTGGQPAAPTAPGASPAAPAAPATAPTGAPRRVKVDAQGNVIQ